MILFLPAAGYGPGSDVWRQEQWVIFMCASPFKPYYLYTEGASGGHLQYLVSAYARRSVRLATVVSELTGVIVLFLPAAGCRWPGFGGDNSWVVLWSSTGQNASQAFRLNIGDNVFIVPHGAPRSFAQSVRLATVVSGLAG